MFGYHSLFPKLALLILILFFGVMAIATAVAYGRPKSGDTRIDMAEVNTIRFNTP